MSTWPPQPPQPGDEKDAGVDEEGAGDAGGPSPANVERAAAVRGTLHPDARDRTVIVAGGDTMESIAQNAGVNVDELLAANRQALDDAARARGHADSVGGTILVPDTLLVLPEQ